MHLYQRDATGALARAVPVGTGRSAIRIVQETATKVAQTPGLLAGLLALKQSFVLQKREAHIGGQATAIIDLIICIVSVLGAVSIIIPYILNRRSRKLRHALILGLATSDLVSSLIIIATSAVPIAGGSLLTASKFCTFAGYSFATTIWTQHLWNLSIAVITYMILVHPLSPFVNNVERHIVWLWPLFWGVSMIVNGAGWAHTGFVDVGGYCSFNPAIAGADFSAAFLFVPRGIVVLTIIVLYTHLFFFLRRTNLFNQVTESNSRISGSRGPGAHSDAVFSVSRRGSRADMLDFSNDAQYVEAQTPKHRGSTASNFIASVKRRFSAPGNVPQPAQQTPEITDGSSTIGDSSKRTGSSSTQGKHSNFTPTLNINDAPQNNSTDGSGTPDRSPKDTAGVQLPARATVAQPTAPLTGVAALRRGSAPLPDLYTRRPSTTFAIIPESHSVAEKREPSVPAHKNHIVPPSILRESGSTRFGMREKGPTDTSEDVDGEEDDDDESLPGADLYRPMAQRRDVRDFGMTSAPQEHLKHYSINPARARQPIVRKDMIGPDDDDDVAEAPATKDRGMGLQDMLAETQDPTRPAMAGQEGQSTYDNVMSENWNWGMAVATPSAARGERGQHSEKRGSSNAGTYGPTLKQLHGRRKSKRGRKWGLFGRDRRVSESEAGATSTSSADEHGVESLGSTLNRQASVLLLLYPGVYCLLFSISIIRIIIDLTSDLTPEEARARQNNALHEISRWTIFAQGFIDAFVFQLIERHFRSRMKRRRRIAAGEQVDDLWHIKVWKVMKRLQRRVSSAPPNAVEEKA